MRLPLTVADPADWTVTRDVESVIVTTLAALANTAAGYAPRPSSSRAA